MNGREARRRQVEGVYDSEGVGETEEVEEWRGTV